MCVWSCVYVCVCACMLMCVCCARTVVRVCPFSLFRAQHKRVPFVICLSIAIPLAIDNSIAVLSFRMGCLSWNLCHQLLLTCSLYPCSPWYLWPGTSIANFSAIQEKRSKLSPLLQLINWVLFLSLSSKSIFYSLCYTELTVEHCSRQLPYLDCFESLWHTA